MKTNQNQPRVIVALDFPALGPAIELVDRLDPGSCRLKIGKEMFTRMGPGLVEKLSARGFDVFLDLKFHDIPNTVAAACEAAADLGVWMTNVHASGGRRMMEAVRDRLARAASRPLVVAVTILTSLAREDLIEVGFSGTPDENVQRLARLAHSSGMDGIVCSPREASAVRSALGPAFLLVTPGVRPKDAATADQQRVMTPAEAIRAGSDYLVVGRPIIAARDPMLALDRISREVSSALSPIAT